MCIEPPPPSEKVKQSLLTFSTTR